MKSKEIEIDEKAPFFYCKLDREANARTLTSIVETYSDGFVLAVNGKWGSGKTTFMKMWEQSLKNDGYKTIFLNVWENDYTSEPLASILGELKSITSTESIATFNSIITKTSKFTTTIAPAIAKTVATIAGLGQIADVVEKLSEATAQAFNDEVSEYKKKKESLQSLKKDLSKFIEENCDGKPLVFIVDELDRCRPDYAVEVLEKIKHFFSVDGIVFVLSIDKEQLKHAIEGYYGSANIDTHEYLRRFIDLEYILPEPNYENFSKYLYDSYGFAEFLEQRERQNTDSLSFSRDYFHTIITAYCQQNKLGLRQLEKLFIHTRITIRTLETRSYAHPEIIFLLIALKEFHPDVYKNLKEVNIDMQTIATELDNIFKNLLSKKDNYLSSYFTNILAKILRFYELDLTQKIDKRSLLERDSDGNDKLLVTFKYANSRDVLESLIHGQRKDLICISMYINKIDLLEPLIS